MNQELRMNIAGKPAIKNWERKTRLSSYLEIRLELRTAIQKELTAVGEKLNIICCVETCSTQLRKMKIFDKVNRIQHTAFIVTPKWLVEGVDLGDKKTAPYAIFHYLVQAHISHDTLDACKQMDIQDYGIDITSQTRTMFRRGTTFLGLEKGEAAEIFINNLQEAIKIANS